MRRRYALNDVDTFFFDHENDKNHPAPRFSFFIVSSYLGRAGEGQPDLASAHVAINVCNVNESWREFAQQCFARAHATRLSYV
jgi:hypothetical protein